MRNPSGQATLVDPYSTKERDTFTCGHCQRIKIVKPKQDPAEIGGLCYVCMKLVCERCVGKGCDPVEEKLKRAEASYHARRSYGL